MKLILAVVLVIKVIVEIDLVVELVLVDFVPAFFDIAGNFFTTVIEVAFMIHTLCPPERLLLILAIFAALHGTQVTAIAQGVECCTSSGPSGRFSPNASDADAEDPNTVNVAARSVAALIRSSRNMTYKIF